MARYWMIFDVGLSTQYDKLFAWLDDNGAEECGDNAATLLSKESYAKVERDIVKLIKSGSRVYLIGPNIKAGKVHYMGRFIRGRRKAPPWSGFGNPPSSEEKDEG
jgi:hypothetical protein